MKAVEINTVYYESREAFFAEAVRRFGADQMDWRFVCPACGHEQSVREMRAAGMSWEAIGFSCIGRWTGTSEGPAREAFGSTGPGPCNYAGGGLFRLAPVQIGDDPHRYFAFAEVR